MNSKCHMLPFAATVAWQEKTEQQFCIETKALDWSHYPCTRNSVVTVHLYEFSCWIVMVDAVYLVDIVLLKELPPSFQFISNTFAIEDDPFSVCRNYSEKKHGGSFVQHLSFVFCVSGSYIDWTIMTTKL